MKTSIEFLLDNSLVTVDCHPRSGLSPTTTVLNYLRSLPQHKGVKEGCAEGDCGACTIVLGELVGGRLRYRAVDSCLVFLPMLHGKQLITIENLKSSDGTLHPVQQAMIDTYGSQCGFCTPGIVMSMFALYENDVTPTESGIRMALAGNLCRCTGYKPIIEATMVACGRERVHRSLEETERTIKLLESISSDSIVLSTERQTYVRPATILEALEFRRDHPDALVMNGATDVALRITKKHELLPLILDLSGVGGLRGWSEAEDGVNVAAGTTMEEFLGLCHGRYPALAKMLGVFGSPQIRNLATVGGNLATASPVGDLMPVLIAHRALILLRSTRGERRVSATDFVAGYRRTAASHDELITRVTLPRVPADTLVRSYKISKRRDLDIATVSSGFRIELENGNRVREVILAYGGMADRVKRAADAEAFLRGKPWNRPTVEKAMEVVGTDFSPISDVRGSAAMRTIAAKNLLLKFWAETAGNGGGE
ncbi:MAG: xanthine dehydrogenase small subunit [Bacteroidota bacterium]